MVLVQFAPAKDNTVRVLQTWGMDPPPSRVEEARPPLAPALAYLALEKKER